MAISWFGAKIIVNTVMTELTTGELIPRLYDVTEGELFVGGQNVKKKI